MKNNKFKLIIEEKEVNYFVWWTICRDFTVSEILKKYLGKAYKNQLVYYENGDGNWATDLPAWNNLGSKLVDNIFNNTFDLDALVNEHLFYGKKIISSLDKIIKQDFSKLKASDFNIWFDEVVYNYLKLNELGFVAVISDVEHGFLTSRLEDILKDKISQDQISKTLNQLITSEKSNIFWQEEREFIALLVKYSKIEDLKNSIEFKKHTKKYNWINFGYIGPSWTEDDFVLRAQEILSKGDPDKSLEEHEDYLLNIKKDREKLEKQLVLEKNQKFAFAVARDFSYVKNYRVGIRYYFCYVINLLFEEFSQKLDIPKLAFYYSGQDEIKDLVFGNLSDYKNILKRKDFFCQYYEADKLSILSKNELDILRKDFIKDKIEDSDQLKGQAAFLGKVTGVVKIVNGPKDLDKVEEGDILVAIYTDPNLLPAMKRAAAFVTEQGGITSHAAIVAREMKKPCLIGTRIATKVFKDGDIVEVDANQGIIKRLK
ncbi:hypothetical protein KKH39_04140 [Patescibacteria group bacterium]|nr:hypothetical protein [Patescibacteria group bacterium]